MDDGSGYFGVGMVFGFVLAWAVVLIGTCDRASSRRNSRSTEACKPATVLSAGNGVAACSDGRVYRWREGYLVQVGRK